MDKEELDFILQEGEGFKIEFKESVNHIDKELIAFANAEGGRIYLGVSDDKKLKGIDVNNRLKSQIQDIARNCDPSVSIWIEEFNNILIVNVLEGKNKPYSCKEGFYLRQGPNSQKMKRDEIIDFIMQGGKLRFDDQLNEGFDFKDIDDGLLGNYLQRMGVHYQNDNRKILFNLGVYDKNKINNAGILFFCSNPKKYFINAYVTCARYKGTAKVKIIDRLDVEGNLINQLEESIKFIQRNTKLEYDIKGLERKEIPEYPLEALREAVLNALMHRDYFERGANVQIDIFDDRITVTNIGGLLKPLTKEKLGKIAIRRNPLIADLFHRVRLVEKMGTGILRIINECRKHGKVSFEVETNGFFISKFLLKTSSKKTVEKTVEKILSLIKKNPKITQDELVKNTGLTRRGIEWNLAQLKERGILKRVGPDKGGHWEVNNV